MQINTAAPTIADVARVAGVSSMTVSRVVNDAPNVLPGTREKVRQAIAELGYVPNSAARSLAGARQCRIAILHSNPSAAYLSEFLVGALSGASENDAQLIVEQWTGAETPAALLARLQAHRIDAVLLPPPLCDDAALRSALIGAGLHTAQVATGEPDTRGFSVSIDDEAAARAMTANLIAQGHRRIGFIHGAANQSASVLRAHGYRSALQDAGIPVERRLIASGDFTYRSGLTAAGSLLMLEDRPTAVFASNDDMAAAVVAVAHRLHLDIPGDLSVCGFDDTTMATTIWPELTTIRQPIARMSAEIVGRLAKATRKARSGSPPSPGHSRVPFELVTRGSDGPPRN